MKSTDEKNTNKQEFNPVKELQEQYNLLMDRLSFGKIANFEDELQLRQLIIDVADKLAKRKSEFIKYSDGWVPEVLLTD